MAPIKASSPFSHSGTSQIDVDILTAKADLMIAVRDAINGNQWTQKYAAEKLGVTQPRISDLKNGMLEKFSLGMLVEFLIKLGFQLNAVSKDRQ